MRSSKIPREQKSSWTPIYSTSSGRPQYIRKTVRCSLPPRPSFMGSVFGKISEETPKYTVLASGEGFEIREYAPNIVAEVEYDGSSKDGIRDGFMRLADYIGALGKPLNVKPASSSAAQEGGAEKIAMTAPVLTQDTSPSEKIAMTAPVLTQENSSGNEAKKKKVMQFVLPASKYSSLENVPRPINPRVVVREVPARKYGVLRFNGLANEKLEAEKVSALRQALESAGYKVIGPHMLAQFNPPWTIYPLRTNEVMLPVE